MLPQASFDILIPDSRIERIAHALRREFRLPEEVQFAATLDPPTTIVTEAGIEMETREIPTFTIAIPHPKHPTLTHLIQGRAPLKSWRNDEWNYRHSSMLEDDPAYQAFRRLAPQAAEWLKNARELITSG